MKDEYNVLLERFKKAMQWFETATLENQMKFYPEFEKILNNINDLYNRLLNLGVKFNGVEIMDKEDDQIDMFDIV